ncbi:gamma-glutamyltransferase family protein [Gymnodinialimonas sp. 2305UL16-5]|uniref:gamma-glutamyltransferase family protein n=1 Tax=Gymnodinialimonas mytili TaxID=3126503 RepID=UPI0030B0D622
MRDFHRPGRSTVFADQGMCATSHPLAAQTAIAILQQGGNAVDAAIAAALLLGICEPQMTGIGGDMFALISKPDGSLTGVNASGRAPAGLDAADLRARGMEKVPAGDVSAITIPGAVDGFCRLHGDMGNLPLDQIVAPAIHYAEAGVPVAPRVAADWEEAVARLQGKARDLFSADGAPFSSASRFAAPAQAEVLRRIATHGRAGFYESEVAEDMVSSLRALGGTHTLDDFAATAATYVTPISTTYRGAELIELPPNGQGATAMLLAHMLERYDIASMDPNGAERAHLEAEATKLAYDARNRFLADPDATARLDHMLSRGTAARLTDLIDPTRAMADPAPLTEATHRETVYLTVVDSNRMAVSMIYSIFSSFGAGLASDKFGILFHDRGAGFTLTEGHPNEAGPGKRPMHTIIPALLREADGSLMPFGVMGGQYQATGHVRFLSNVVDFGMGPQAAIDAPRCFADADLGGLRVEDSYAPSVRDELAALGHTVIQTDLPIGGAQAIRIRADGVLEGGSDPRKDGIALGY